jgi:D-alanine-D-alanine ligase
MARAKFRGIEDLRGKRLPALTPKPKVAENCQRGSPPKSLTMPLIPPIPVPTFPRGPQPERLWLLMGGVSPEHEVSLSSALTVLRNFEPDRYLIRPVCIMRSGLWCLAPELVPTPLTEEQTGHLKAEFTAEAPTWGCLPPAEALATLEREQPELAFILMHGPQGEDGGIQRDLESVPLNYVGSGIAASELAIDKRRTQSLLADRGLPIPDFEALSPQKSGSLETQRDRVLERIGLPCVTKPSRSGSSVGIRIVREEAQWLPAIEEALRHDPETVLCERFIEGREVTCGVLEVPEGERIVPWPLAVTEISPCEDEFFDYHAKYTAGASEETTPASLDETLTEEIQRLSVEIHREVGARGFSRSDFIVDTQGQPQFLEINTIPGMTPTSLLPQGAAACGIDFSTLLTILVETARVSPIKHP